MQAQDIAYQERDIVQENPTEQELVTWQALSGLPWKRFFNTNGRKYQELGLKERLPAMPEREQIQLLASDGLLVKRPLVIGPDFVLVGFKQAEWAEAI